MGYNFIVKACLKLTPSGVRYNSEIDGAYSGVNNVEGLGCESTMGVGSEDKMGPLAGVAEDLTS
jgi:hypothetical protein